MKWMKQAGKTTRNFVGWIIIIALYLAIRVPEYSSAEKERLAKNFGFYKVTLPTIGSPTQRSVRPVNPSLKRIEAWMSSVGAAATLGDLDADGCPNDVVYVDTRSDQVIVCPAPETGQRYPAFSLQAPSLPYDAQTIAPMGTLMGDFNEDGDADVLIYYWGRSPVLFLRKDRTVLGAEAFERKELLPVPERWFTNSGLQGDWDGDGHTDLLLSNYFADGAHILDAHATTHESMQSSMATGFNGGRKAFLLWTPHGFNEAETNLPQEVVHAWTLATGACDLDNDLLPELYLANDFGPDRLLHNESVPGQLRFRVCEAPITFTQGKSRALGHDSFKGMGVDFGDLNSDGIPDIFVSNITTPYALHESNFLFLSSGDVSALRSGIAPYREASTQFNIPQSGWCWDARLVDFNNDGIPEAIQATGFVKGEINRWPQLQELAMGTDAALSDPDNWPQFGAGDDIAGHQSLPFYARASDGRFCNIAPELKLDNPQVLRGLAVGDVDHDGRLDFVAAGQWQDSYLYRNTARRPGAFIGLHLQLPVSIAGKASRGRPAFGATAEVTLPGGRTLRAQVDGGNGHSGKRAPEIHFGLGDCPETIKLPVTIRWRDTNGTKQLCHLLLNPGWHDVLLTNGKNNKGGK
jgi:enediyne biosynthesis protein E4